MHVEGHANVKYYERPICRARAMYRIPTSPVRMRTLELFHGSASILTNANWPGEGSVLFELDTHCAQGARESLAPGNRFQRGSYLDSLPFPDGTFDLVILHRTLDCLATAEQLRGAEFRGDVLLANVARVLAAGGVVAGCVDNRSSIKNLRRLARPRGGSVNEPVRDTHFYISTLKKMLTNAEFVDVRLFSLLPNCDAPLRLIDITPFPSKVAFRREIEAARHLYSHTGYLARRLAVELGLYPFLEESFFFWAYKNAGPRN